MLRIPKLTLKISRNIQIYEIKLKEMDRKADNIYLIVENDIVHNTLYVVPLSIICTCTLDPDPPENYI